MKQRFEQIKNIIASVLEQLQEHINSSNKFNSLKEKYESLPLFSQKMIKSCTKYFLILCILIIPLYYFYSSTKVWRDFHKKWTLSLDLLNYTKYSPEVSTQTSFSARQKITSTIKKYQEKDYEIKDSSMPIKDKDLKKIDYTIAVKHLNVRQLARLGADLEAVPNSYLHSISLKASEEYPKRYDVSFILSVYFAKVQNRLRSSSPRLKPQKKRDRSKTRSRKTRDRSKKTNRRTRNKKSTTDRSKKLNESKTEFKKPSSMPAINNFSSERIKNFRKKREDTKKKGE